ncbi:hypothetical protein BC833DRAFT_592563 [Globomyces pollinis-pini]|nr:hypothetical protein BC833DRAFT_592563 [Globomyces pollinis-pini]
MVKIVVKFLFLNRVVSGSTNIYLMDEKLKKLQQLLSANHSVDGETSELFNDPIAFYATLIKPKVCPLSKSLNRDDCIFPETPQSGNLTWGCPAGNYCLNPNQIEQCQPGFYCPENTTQPIFCPASYFCSNDTKTLSLCPENYYCPKSTVKPFSCHFMASCPEGTASTRLYGLIGFIFLAIICLHVIIRIDKMIRDETKRRLDIHLKKIALPTIIDYEAISPIDNPLNIEFKDLKFCLNDGSTILSGINGRFNAGRFCAVMGPSGAGKTTLISLLLGTVRKTSGEILINGSVNNLSNYSKKVGFVPQDDIMHRDLPIREMLLHAGRMRLHQKSAMELQLKVNETIKALDLSTVADDIVGDELVRGISGGQRKRVSIGLELVTEPSVLFLDEPTSGLDSSVSFEICKNLRQITRVKQLCTVAIIHSPNPAVFNTFDDLLLLGKGGKVVYFGPIDTLHDYFDRIGFPCDSDDSIADHLMDVLDSKIPSLYRPDFTPNMLFGYWAAYLNGSLQFTETRMTLNEARQKKNDYDLQNLNMLTVKLLPDNLSNTKTKIFKPKYGLFKYFNSSIASMIATVWSEETNGPSFLIQTWYLGKRYFSQIIRNTTALDLLFHFAGAMVISIGNSTKGYQGPIPDMICYMSPLVLFNICQEGIDTLRLAGLYFNLCIFICAIATSVRTFGKEKLIFWRERRTGINVFAYFISKLFLDIPSILVDSLCFCIGLYGFYPFMTPFGDLYLLVLLAYFNGFGMGYIISFIFPDNLYPMANFGLSILFNFLLGGGFPTIESVQNTLSALSPYGIFDFVLFFYSLSPTRWAIEGNIQKLLKNRILAKGDRIPTIFVY